MDRKEDIKKLKYSIESTEPPIKLTSNDEDDVITDHFCVPTDNSFNIIFYNAIKNLNLRFKDLGGLENIHDNSINILNRFDKQYRGKHTETFKNIIKHKQVDIDPEQNKIIWDVERAMTDFLKKGKQRAIISQILSDYRYKNYRERIKETVEDTNNHIETIIKSKSKIKLIHIALLRYTLIKNSIKNTDFMEECDIKLEDLKESNKALGKEINMLNNNGNDLNGLEKITEPEKPPQKNRLQKNLKLSIMSA